jgi:aminoglycoside 6-adenylyltransferase
MRSEHEMVELIINTAQKDARVRAVIMNGSRVNPNAPRDIFQDYDIVYIVSEVEPFIHDFTWIAQFGELMILQMPEDILDPPPSNDGCFVYLMQFTDGNRIDLTLYPISKLDQLGKDSLSLLLLDKDGIIPPFDPPSDLDYRPQPPTAKQFADCCNEFWWVAPYVAKGLWREEITYAKHMLDVFVRDEFMKMIAWSVGVKTHFTQSSGKNGKYARKFLKPEEWDRLMLTYADASYEHTWEALEAMCDLFHRLAVDIAEQFGFDYPHDDARRVWAHIKYIRLLPRDAKTMYE